MRFGVAILAVLLAGAAPVRAAEVFSAATTDAGSVQAAFLSVGMGARAVGMGEAFTAVADDPSAIIWNPGGLGQLRRSEVLLTYDSAGAGVGLAYGALAVPVGPGTLGMSLTMLTFGEYMQTDSNGLPLGNSSVTDTMTAVAYGLPNPGWLGGRGWSGLSIEYVSETVGVSLLGFGAGSVVPLAEGLTAGWAVQHIGPGSGGFSLPGVARAGVAYLLGGVARVSAEGGYELASREPTACVGVEAKPHRMLAVRAGYSWHGGGTAPAGLTGLTAGGGVRYGPFGLDYAFQAFGDLAMSHRVAFLYRWQWMVAQGKQQSKKVKRGK